MNHSLARARTRVVYSPRMNTGDGGEKTKAELRLAIRERLRAFTAVEIAAKSERICETIRALPEWQNAKTVCLFAAQTSEPDLEPLWKDAAGKTVCYPRVRGSDLDLIAAENPAELVPSRWGIREPVFDERKIVALSRCDIIFVPGLAFSRDGSRLGRGGGFYDRLLTAATLRARKIGVCFQEQLFVKLPTEAHDREVDVVVSDG